MLRIVACALGALLLLSRTADAQIEPGLACRAAIRDAERRAAIPTQLMAAIGRIESGRRDAQGVIHPWPWTINVEGDGHIYESKPAAIAAVRAFQAAGARSIDVGCMQVNLLFHPDAFASLDEAFDPAANARYAARFLNALFDQTHDWTRATALYHSATPVLGTDYQRKVAAVLPDERRKVGLTPPAATAGNVWSTNVWTANVWNSHGPAWPVEAPIPMAPYALRVAKAP
jgi:soluble lytic murein transglycosylase-like protein